MASKANSSRVQVSQMRTLSFYVNLSKKILASHGEVTLSALGLAISFAVTIAEILKNNGYVEEKSVQTSTVEVGEGDNTGQKAKIELQLAARPGALAEQQ